MHASASALVAPCVLGCVSLHVTPRPRYSQPGTALNLGSHGATDLGVGGCRIPVAIPVTDSAKRTNHEHGDFLLIGFRAT